MKILLIGASLSWLFGQAVGPAVGAPQWLENSATVVGFGLLCWVIVKHIPRMQSSFEEVIGRIVTSNDTNIGRLMDEQREDRKQFSVAMADITAEIRRGRE